MGASEAEGGWKTRRNLGTEHRKLLGDGNANAQREKEMANGADGNLVTPIYRGKNGGAMGNRTGKTY